MAEAEDVITDAARHATSFVAGLWRRHKAPSVRTPTLTLAEVAPRLDLLITAVFGRSWRLRAAQPPARPTVLARLLQSGHRPSVRTAIPATDGNSIWLPAETGLTDAALALERFRTVALQQAMRIVRGSAAGADTAATPLANALYLLIEAQSADADLARLFPGLQAPLSALRAGALRARPALARFAAERQPLEAWVRRLLASPCTAPGAAAPHSRSPRDSRAMARALAHEIQPDAPWSRWNRNALLYKDWWTGELLASGASPGPAGEDGVAPDMATGSPPRSARMPRRPEVREAQDEEDDARPGAWMIQPAAPHEVAEDPFGLQRPTDRNTETPADEFAESLAELAEARLVSTPGRPKEVLLSDDPPTARATHGAGTRTGAATGITYPEWDYRIQSYREPGATVRLLPATDGPQAWVDATLAEHRSMLNAIRRRFEMLLAQRTPLRRQRDGDMIDLDACVDARADWHAGHPMAEALYLSHRRARQDLAILLLIDVSGSTDGWVSSGRRVIDVEREALLLVCIALGAIGEPYAVQAFSGQGPHSVGVRTLKRFDEPYGNAVATRIAALEPDQYTRAGTAIRHASATLMRQPAAHRLLLLLSDGKPNDVDAYAGRYGVEDMRSAVVEAKLQAIAPFCLTVDRQAAAYLGRVFGAGHYAVLAKPAMLPTALLDWMHQLVKGG